MNGKGVENRAAVAPLASDHPNPFTHKVEFSSAFEKFKTAVFTVAILPIRVIVICGLLILAWCLACVGLYGISEDDLRTKPITGWRKKLREVIAIVGQLTYRIGGMVITVKGRQATREEAPILVIAPHSSFLDTFAFYVAGLPSIIARWEIGTNPWMGKLINFTQSVYVWRDDADSRQNTIREITRRAVSDLGWPQILIFPEGTCTNRSCLITFKAGAFYPGVPVQPVCIRYPNKPDTVTWTWEGPGALKVLWLTLTQIHSSCEIEFLPVYRPNAQEKEDPKLFANNVRNVMAEALGIPVTNYTYGDGRLMALAQRFRLSIGSNVVELQNCREILGLHETHADESYLDSAVDASLIDRHQFAKRLQVSKHDPAFVQLCELCEGESAFIDWLEYLLAVLVLKNQDNVLEIVKGIFVMMSKDDDVSINQDLFQKVTARILGWPPDKSIKIFSGIAINASTIKLSSFVEYVQKHKLLPNGVVSRLKSD